MIRAVVDASAALSWLLPSQATAASRRFEQGLNGYALEAPAVFEWEVHNILLGFVRGGRMDEADYAIVLHRLTTANVNLAPPQTVWSVLPLAQFSRLALFDAAYLDRALNQSIALITRDRQLLSVAQTYGIAVHDLN